MLFESTTLILLEVLKGSAGLDFLVDVGDVLVGDLMSPLAVVALLTTSWAIRFACACRSGTAMGGWYGVS